MVLMNLEAADAVYTADNDVEIYTDGTEKFQALYEEIQNAKEFVHIQYYIIRNDALWKHFEELLIEKVKHTLPRRHLQLKNVLNVGGKKTLNI
jgi:cardiolipin synthase